MLNVWKLRQMEKNTSGSESQIDVSEFAWIRSSLPNRDHILNACISSLKIKTLGLQVTAVVKICRPSVSADFIRLIHSQSILSYSVWASMEACSKNVEMVEIRTAKLLLYQMARIHRGVSKRRPKESSSVLYSHIMCIRKCQNLFDQLFFGPATVLRPSWPLSLKRILW